MLFVFCFSALVKLLNKSIEGTADDDEEGVTPDTAIRSGLELLKVKQTSKQKYIKWLQMIVEQWCVCACFSIF